MEVVEIDLEILLETEKAIRVTDGDKQCWIAKSLIENYDDDWEIGNTETMSVPEWLALEEGLI
jgi:hypothetical protein